jgi:hypothetical protein
MVWNGMLAIGGSEHIPPVPLVLAAGLMTWRSGNQKLGNEQAE